MGAYPKLLIKNAAIFDGTDYCRGDVLIEKGVIADIREGITCPDAEVIDIDGKLLAPGLIDIHTHLRNVSNTTFGVDASLCTIPFGVTAAVDGGASRGDEAYLDTLNIKSAVFVGVSIRGNKALLEKTDETAAKYGKYLLGYKVYFDTKVSEVTDVSPLKEVCDFAKSRGRRVMVHCSNSPVPMTEIVKTLNPGDILTHPYHGGVNTAADEGFEAIFLAKQKGVIVDAGLAGHVHTDFKVLKAAIAAGATPDTVSSDITRLSAFVRGGRYGLTACMSIMRHVGMKEKDILRAVTSSAARAVNRENVWGSVKAGDIADLAVLDYAHGGGFSFTDAAGNHIESNIGYKCVLTIINGDIVYTA